MRNTISSGMEIIGGNRHVVHTFHIIIEYIFYNLIKQALEETMDLMEKLNKKEIREFFSKGWMTHDAMWLYHCLQEFGAEKANKVNQAAVKSMAAIEIQRVLKLMNKEKGVITSFEELKEIIDTTFKLILPKFMKFYYSFPEKNRFRGGFYECFAHDGLKKFGMLDFYQCAIITRVQGWIDGLGVKYDLSPEFTGCLMHKNGKCEMEFKFDLA
jgi:hypothetical protein